MPELTSDLLARAIEKTSAAECDLPFFLLRAARAEHQHAAPTLLGLWRREGMPLAEPLDYELDLFLRRSARYAEIRRELESLDGVRATKGSRIAAMYPEGVPRETNDVDCMVERRSQLWGAAAGLVDRGWTPSSLTILRVDDEPQVLVRLEREAEDPVLVLPELVELASVGLFGDLRGIPPRRALLPGSEPVVVDLALVVVERLERPFGGRDLVDAGLLLERLGDQAPALWAALDDLDLWPEWRELEALAAAVGVLPADVRPPADRARRSVRARGRRLARGLRGLLPPARAAVSVAQRRTMSRASEGPWLDRGLRLLSERLADPERVLALGLPLFGFPLENGRDGRETTDELVLEPSRRLVLARTPVGRFALVSGDVVDEESLAALEA